MYELAEKILGIVETIDESDGKKHHDTKLSEADE